MRRFSLELVKELKPRPVTRDLDWGVRVPVPGYEEREDKRIYVWIDAVVGYLSAAVEWARTAATLMRGASWWQNPDSRHYYFMGKDNIVFHSVIWPASSSATERAVRSAQAGDGSSCPTTSSAARS